MYNVIVPRRAFVSSSLTWNYDSRRVQPTPRKQPVRGPCATSRLPIHTMKLCCLLLSGCLAPAVGAGLAVAQPGSFPYNRLSRFTYKSSTALRTHLTENEILFSSAKASDVHSAGWIGFKPSAYNYPPVRFSHAALLCVSFRKW